jgi:thioredoxin 1
MIQVKNYFLLVVTIIGLFSCSNGQAPAGYSLSTGEFSEKTKKIPGAAVIDVRTPEEFVKGHLQNAINIDWNGNDFDKQILKLDKSKPVFVYCLSGRRSADAASKMRADGFNEVYELEGGIMKWRAASLPESKAGTSTGMTKEQFDDLLKTKKWVLVDFYADWCAPCKKMKPYLEEISKEMKGKVQVIRINADDNQALCKELKVDALPVLQLYKNKSLTWNNAGYIDKEGILKMLE